MSKIKLYLASYFQPENHGPGKKYGISPDKPENLDYDIPSAFPFMSPDRDVMINYHKEKYVDPKSAGEKFVRSYKDKLTNFVAELSADCDVEGKKPQEMLPFQDGDTLLSWEHKGHMTYRNILAEYLEGLGYEVIKN